MKRLQLAAVVAWAWLPQIALAVAWTPLFILTVLHDAVLEWNDYRKETVG